jgi:cytochrome c peroxidase
MGIGVDEAVHRLNADPEYVHRFRAALDSRPTAAGMARALAAFQRTLYSRQSRVDRFVIANQTGALSPLERDGLDLFTGRAGCGQCHHLAAAQIDDRQPKRLLLTDFQFHNLGVGYHHGGLSDVGRYELSRHRPEWGAFRTPSLRNVARSQPYMHDGSLATLDDVIEFYNGGGEPNPNRSPLLRPLHLGDHEKQALVAFLRALSD